MNEDVIVKCRICQEPFYSNFLSDDSNKNVCQKCKRLADRNSWKERMYCDEGW